MNDDDRTVIFSSVEEGDENEEAPEIRVRILDSDSQQVGIRTFSDSFSVGRALDNDLIIDDEKMSRYHLSIKVSFSEWRVYDAGSTNGSYINERLVKSGEKLNLPTEIYLGKSRLLIDLADSTEVLSNDTDALSQVTQIVSQNESNLTQASTSVPSSFPRENLSRKEIKRRFLDHSSDGVGEYTQMVREVIQEDKKKKSRKYKWSIGVIVFLLTCSIGFTIYQQNIISNARNLAIDIFYDMKSLEVEVSLNELRLQNENSLSLQADIKAKRKKLHDMQSKYKSYVDELNSLSFTAKVVDRVKRNIGGSSSPLSDYEKELVLKVAQKFGECDLELPEGFVSEVGFYINKWKQTSRLNTVMKKLELNSHASVITSAMEENNLPKEFLYLGLVESNFDAKAIGPETKYGIAKGAWQFLPGTGRDFGLTPGELADVREYDPADERFIFDKSTRAAAKYLKHIYSTEAQASGLLVMAGYNYGHNRVKRMIKKMPDNPRDKNFWKFIQKYEIPEETYNYVFSIFAAAVIGEDPQHFGFDFQSPLEVN